MKTVVRPLFFADGKPVDPELHAAALEFCARELKGEINFADYRDILVVCRENKTGCYYTVVGIACGVLRYDVPVLRFLDAKAGKKVLDRINDRLQDAGLVAGTEVFVFVDQNEPAESKCPAQAEWINNWKAEPSKRLSVRLR